MIVFSSNDLFLSTNQIEKFIDKRDKEGHFATKDRWHENFEDHFNKLMNVRQVITYREKGDLVGLCSWALVDNKSKQKINKSRWLLPENVSEGDILYVDTCLLQAPASIFKVKRFLEEKYRPGIKEVFWYDMPHSRVFRLKFKGGGKWPQTAG